MKGPIALWGSAALVALALACTGGGSPRPAVSPPPQSRYTRADVDFMSGMIAHHAQAIVMAGWAASHGASPSIRTLAERIVVAQNDEIALAQRWLREHQEPVPPADAHGHMMPGMLTPEQMAQLDAARGPDFDRLFLTFMIQHHQGALQMVEQLLATPGAAQDGPVYRFSADVFADQSTEIERMSRMLEDLKRSAQ